MKKKEELCSFAQQENSAMAETDIRMVPIAELQDFEGHNVVNLSRHYPISFCIIGLHVYKNHLLFHDVLIFS